LRRRKRKSFVSSFLNTLGISSVFAMALAFNCALFPQAYAQARAGMQAPLDFFFSPSAESASTATAKANPQAAPVNEADVHLLAATTWAEARSEGEIGMRAVAHVIVNRIGDRFGGDLQTVVLSPKQFSSWNLGDPNRRLAQDPERYATGGADKETWDTALEVARQVLSGQSTDPTGGALFYHTRAVHPGWDRFGTGRQVIGAHVFFHDVAEGEHIRTASMKQHFAAFGEGSRRGPRAGRVDGVLQYAPPSMAGQMLPGEKPGDLPPSDPAPATAPNGASIPPLPASAT
jgi:spore germination cell wall hydrolase CwlJ-like protein